MDGKNVADFIDPEIEAKLDALEMEEEKLIQEGFYDQDLEEDESTKEENKAIKKASAIIKAKKEALVQMHRISQGKNRPTLPRKGLVKRKTVDDLEEDLASRGRTMTTTSKVLLEARMAKKRGRSLARGGEDMDVDMEDGAKNKKLRGVSVKRSMSRSRSVVPQRDRSVLGLKSEKQIESADKMKKKSQKSGNLMAKRGESDRQIQTKMPKHLFSGKRGFQADRR
jgi:nucleolar GTP-binding protein